MDDLWLASIVLIRSSNPTHKSFGTGFTIHCDGQVTYIITCAHVVDDIMSEIMEGGGGSDMITAADAKATLVASGFKDGSGIDIAVLRVEKPQDQLPLRRASNEEAKAFRTAGFQRPDKDFTIRQLNGVFSGQIGIGRGAQANFVKAWDLEIKDPKHHLQDGYSGSPVVDERNYAVAVVNTREGEGNIGTAISVEALEKVWPGMPLGLFEQDTVVTIENKHDLFHSRGVVGGSTHPAIRLKPMPQGRNFAEMTSVLFQRASKSSPHLMQQPQNRTMNAIISEWSEADRTDNPLILIFDFAADIEFALFSIARQLHGCQWVDGSGFTDASSATWKEEERTTVNIDNRPASVFLVDFSSVALSHVLKQLPDAAGKTASSAFKQRLATFLSWAKSAHHQVVFGLPKYLLPEVNFASFQKQTDYIFIPEKLFSATYLDRVKQYKQHLRSTIPFPDLLTSLVSANSSSLPIVLAQSLSEITSDQVVIEENEHETVAILLNVARNLTALGFYEIAFRLESYCVTLEAKRKGIALQTDVFLNADSKNESVVVSLDSVADLPIILPYGAITGDTGLGKTTALHQIEHQWTIPRSNPDGKSIETYLPLYVSILPDSEFDLLKQIEGTFSSDVFARIEVGTKIYQLACHELISERKSFWALQQLFSSPILLLLDNVDTLSNRDQDKMEEDIKKLKVFSQELGTLMAFREEVTPQFQHLDRAKLRLLSEEQVKDLLRSHHSDMSIHSLLYQNPKPISLYLRNPLLLEMICSLGLTSADIREASLNDLLERYVNRTRSKLGTNNAKRIIDEWLPEVARHYMLEHQQALLSEDNPYSELIYLASRVELLANLSGNRNIVEFKFDYLRDYFLAQQLANEILRSGVERALTVFIEDIRQLGQSVLQWENVFKILINRIFQNDIDAYIEFLSRKVDDPHLVHICLLELGSKAHYFLRTSSIQLSQSIKNFDISLEKRIIYAHILGHLDPRIPPIETTQLALVEVPQSEHMPHYRIAKYPVTNMEFARFVQAQGYQKQEYWTKPSWAWRQNNRVLFPLYWNNEKLNRPNYPVVGVSFFEARAYCVWLSKYLKANVDLPSVFQWDRAAHGSEKQFELLLELFRETFQKGKVPDKSILREQLVKRKSAKVSKTKHYGSDGAEEKNKELDRSVESKLIDELISIASASMKPYLEQMGYAIPMPIGMFPGNAIGCHDLYGNVWEWTNSPYSHIGDDVENLLTTTSVDPGTSVIVKGGTTGAVNSSVWTMLGGWFDPSVRFHKLGFRIVFVENPERL